MLAILLKVEAGRWTLLSSTVLSLELARIPNALQRSRAQQFLSLAREHAKIAPAAVRCAVHLRGAVRLGKFDALHLACAKSLRANVFLTTDDRLLRATRRLADLELPFTVSNPLVWLTAFLKKE